MLNTTDKIIKHKTGLLNLAEELGNVSKACQVMGMSRDTFRHDLANFKTRLKALEAKVAEDGGILTEAQVQALERKKLDDEACGEIETAHPGYLGSQDTFYGLCRKLSVMPKGDFLRTQLCCKRRKLLCAG